MVLIQQNLVQFYPPGPPRATFYEADVYNAYNLVRIPKHVRLIEKRFGKVAAELVSELQFQGFAELYGLNTNYAQLTENLESNYQSVAPNGPQEALRISQSSRTVPDQESSVEDPASRPELTSAFEKLNDSEYFEHVRDITFIPRADFRMVVEDIVKLENEDFRGPMNGPKKIKMFNALVKAKSRNIVEDGEPIDSTESSIESDSDESLEGFSLPLERTRVFHASSPHVNGISASHPPLPEKCPLVNRNQVSDSVDSPKLSAKRKRIAIADDEEVKPETENTPPAKKSKMIIEIRAPAKADERSDADLEEAPHSDNAETASQTSSSHGKTHIRRHIDNFRPGRVDDESEESLPHQAANKRTNGTKRPIIRQEESKTKDVIPKSRKRKAAALEDVDRQEGLRSCKAIGKQYWPYSKEREAKKQRRDAAKDEDLEQADADIVRMNDKKLLVSHRTEILVALVTRLLGESCGKLFETILHLLEPKIKRCWSDDKLPDPASTLEEADEDVTIEEDDMRVSTEEILKALDQRSKATLVEHANIIRGKSKKRKMDESSDDEAEPGAPEVSKELEDNSNSNSNNKTTATNPARHPKNGLHKKNGLTTEAYAAQHSHETVLASAKHFLAILLEHPYNIIYRASNESNGEWTVDIDSLIRKMMQNEIEKVISARFGTTAARIVRILYERGRLEEKHILPVALERAKEMRALLSELLEAGVLELMEVPGHNVKARDKSTWLWSFDQERVRGMVLEDTYKAMARLMQRIKVEKGKYDIEIERREILEAEGRLGALNKREKYKLGEWERVEEMLLLQVSRLDDAVMVLRDFVRPSAI